MEICRGKFISLFVVICCFTIIQGNVEISNSSHVNDSANDQNLVIEPNKRYLVADSKANKLLDLHSLCTCDLSYDYCDINCCCDEDCSSDDVKTFSKCRDNVVVVAEDDNLCEHLSNGTDVIEKSDSAFCIWKDNYKERHFLPDVQGVSSLEEFDQLLSQAANLESVNRNGVVSEAIDLSNLIFVNNSSVRSVLGIPYPAVGSSCNAFLPVQFLQNEEIECFQVLQSLEAECETNVALNAASFYKDITVINADESEISVELCSGNILKCVKAFEDLPTPNYNDTECKNVVSSVEYIVNHVGQNNILKVTARIRLRNVADERQRQSLWVKQKFKITFEWYEDKAAIHLSGNPGYVVGYPVLASAGRSNRNSSYNQWLTVPMPSGSGNCLDSIPTPVLFGENVVSSCSISVSGASAKDSCHKLEHVLDMVLGSFPSYIGAYGNSSRNKTGDWVPLLCEDSTACFRTKLVSEDKCKQVIRKLHIELAYVYAGFADNPQAKIIGSIVKRSVHEVHPVQFSERNRENFRLLTFITISVAFVDVTVSPKSVFAPFPTFDIRLPYDFFYPFV